MQFTKNVEYNVLQEPRKTEKEFENDQMLAAINIMAKNTPVRFSEKVMLEQWIIPPIKH